MRKSPLGVSVNCTYHSQLNRLSPIFAPSPNQTHPPSTHSRPNTNAVLHINCPGTTGHGSQLHANTAGTKVASILGNFMRFRQAEAARLAADAALTVGDVTTINLTMLHGGVQVNVVPPAMRLSFDIRLAVTVDHAEFEKMVFVRTALSFVMDNHILSFANQQLNRWCTEAGADVTIEYDLKTAPVEPTKLDATNAFWLRFEAAAQKL